jgi:hypothetical protein
VRARPGGPAVTLPLPLALPLESLAELGPTTCDVTRTAMSETVPTKRTHAPTIVPIVTNVFFRIGSLSMVFVLERLR